MNKIKSFKTFSELKEQENKQHLEADIVSKREQSAIKIAETLAEMEIISLTELTKEQKKQFVAKLFNEDTAEEIEDKINDMGKPKTADIEDGEELKTDVSESIITEGTRWQFGLIDKNGNIQSNYVHFDGYPSSVVPMLKNYTVKDVKTTLIDSAMGGMRSLETNPKQNKYYNDAGDSTIAKGNVNNVKKYLKEVGDEAGAEYVYLYDERDGQWYGADVYTDKELKPVGELKESVVTEGKDDFMARSGSANINLKKGYKHHTEEELTDLYNRLGDLVKTLNVKDVTLVFEAVFNEAEVKSDADFKEYAETVLQKAFGEDYDEAKAQEVIDGLTSKYSGDYGAMVGALQSSLD